MDIRALGRRGALSGSLAAALAAGATARKALARPDQGVADDGVADGGDGHGPFRAAWLAWLRTESGRFDLPVSVGTAAPQTELSIRGVNPAIRASLTDGCEIVVGVEWHGRDCGALGIWAVDGKPGPGGIGWVDDDLLPEHRTVHPTREALWRAEVFEEFLTWINGDFAHATDIAIWLTDPYQAMPYFGAWPGLARDGRELGTDRPIKGKAGTSVHLLMLHGFPT